MRNPFVKETPIFSIEKLHPFFLRRSPESVVLCPSLFWPDFVRSVILWPFLLNPFACEIAATSSSSSSSSSSSAPSASLDDSECTIAHYCSQRVPFDSFVRLVSIALNFEATNRPPINTRTCPKHRKFFCSTDLFNRTGPNSQLQHLPQCRTFLSFFATFF